MTTNQLLWLDQDGLRVGGTQLVTSGGGVGIGTSSIAGALTVGSAVGTSGSTSSVALTVYGSGVYNGSQNFNNITETTALVSSGVSGVINYYVGNQSVLYYTANAGSNWTVNLTFSPTTLLNSAMVIGQSMTVVLMATQGGTAYYNSTVQVDGNSITPKWQGGTAPSAGNASGVDIYVYTIVKTGSAAFTIFASQTQFK
jgi:hypothetical protein